MYRIGCGWYNSPTDMVIYAAMCYHAIKYSRVPAITYAQAATYLSLSSAAYDAFETNRVVTGYDATGRFYCYFILAQLPDNHLLCIASYSEGDNSRGLGFRIYSRDRMTENTLNNFESHKFVFPPGGLPGTPFAPNELVDTDFYLHYSDVQFMDDAPAPPPALPRPAHVQEPVPGLRYAYELDGLYVELGRYLGRSMDERHTNESTAGYQVRGVNLFEYGALPISTVYTVFLCVDPYPTFISSTKTMPHKPLAAMH